MIKKPYLYFIILIFLSCSENNEELSSLSTDTKQLIFPDTPKLVRSLLDITIENNNNEDIKINSYSIPDGFRIKNFVIPLTVKSQSSINLSVVFYPTETKLYEEELIILNNSEKNPEIKIELIGNGLPNHLNSLSFNISSQKDVDFLSKYDSVTLEKLTISDINFDDPINSFDGLENVKSINEFILFETHNTISFEAFANTEIKELVAITERWEQDLSFLKDIIRENISYFIFRNKTITDISILGSLKNIDRLEISSNQILTNLDALENTAINSRIIISDNTSLRDFCGIQSSAYNIETRISDNGYNPTEENFKTGNCKR